VNIFGGFAVTQRMLAMYKKKERPAAQGGKADA
jgi:NAD(P) transhydrogenase subunit alpha